jgi:LysR family transcriptional regulator, hca operon transcriptional activator
LPRPRRADGGARRALLQVNGAGKAAPPQPEKQSFAIGFLGGQSLVWLPETLRILRGEQPEIEITQPVHCPEVAGAPMHCKADVAFLRREKDAAGIVFVFK